MTQASRRRFITHTLAGATSLALPAPALHAQSRPVLKAGDQKGGLRALLEAAGSLEGLSYDIQWSSSRPPRRWPKRSMQKPWTRARSAMRR